MFGDLALHRLAYSLMIASASASPRYSSRSPCKTASASSVLPASRSCFAFATARAPAPLPIAGRGRVEPSQLPVRQVHPRRLFRRPAERLCQGRPDAPRPPRRRAAAGASPPERTIAPRSSAQPSASPAPPAGPRRVRPRCRRRSSTSARWGWLGWSRSRASKSSSRLVPVVGIGRGGRRRAALEQLLLARRPERPEDSADHDRKKGQ